MYGYRRRSGDSSVPVVNVRDRGRDNVPTQSLLAQYGVVEDDMDVGGPDESGAPQTVEQEYNNYVNGTLSARTLDILKFWEVSDIM